MARTRGTKRLPLDPSLMADLKALGFIQRDIGQDAGYHLWQHKRQRTIRVEISRLNLAGSDRVVAQVLVDRASKLDYPQHVQSTTPVALVADLTELLALLETPNRALA